MCVTGSWILDTRVAIPRSLNDKNRVARSLQNLQSLIYALYFYEKTKKAVLLACYITPQINYYLVEYSRLLHSKIVIVELCMSGGREPTNMNIIIMLYSYFMQLQVYSACQ